MITGVNPYSVAASLGRVAPEKENLSGQNFPGKADPKERIAEVGFKAYIREIQMDKLEAEARAHALRNFNLTEEKLEKIGAVASQKLEELEANIQDYITEYLQKQIKADLIKEAHEQGKEGYRQGALLDLQV